MTQTRYILALDVGTRRIGVAKADLISKIAFPLTTVEVDGSELTVIKQLIDENDPTALVVGFPRNQQGDPTAQTEIVKAFTVQLETYGVPIVFQDESLTSVMAEERLKAQTRSYTKGDIDAMAAAIILTDYMESH